MVDLRAPWAPYFTSLDIEISPVDLVVTMSICTFIHVCKFCLNFFEVSHWPSDQMITPRPLIGQPSFPLPFPLNSNNPD